MFTTIIYNITIMFVITMITIITIMYCITIICVITRIIMMIITIISTRPWRTRESTGDKGNITVVRQSYSHTHSYWYDIIVVIQRERKGSFRAYQSKQRG